MSDGPRVDALELRRVAGRFATGVTIVTAEHEGTPCGLTVNAFLSLSLDPPLVLVSIDRAARSLRCVDGAQRFAVNVLAEGQEELARRFATKEESKFAGVRTRLGVTGLPLIEGAHAYVECRTERRIEGGDHVVFVGSVAAIALGEGRPLLFYRGAYHALHDRPAS